MGIGAIGSVTTTAYSPYVYNTNHVSALSLNKIKPISDDVTKGGVDLSGITENKPENINPLKPGESKNFADILLSQFSASSYKQAQVLQTNPIEE